MFLRGDTYSSDQVRSALVQAFDIDNDAEISVQLFHKSWDDWVDVDLASQSLHAGGGVATTRSEH